MTGTLQKKGNIFYAVIQIKTENGKFVYKWISTKKKNKKEARIVLREILTQMENDEYVFQNKTMFHDFIEHWLTNVIKNQIEETTYDGYSIQINKHIIPYFKEKNIKIQDLNGLHLEEYFNYKCPDYLSANTIKKHYHNINQILDHAVKLNLIRKNPAKDVTLPKIEKYIPEFYSVEQLEKLMSVSKNHDLETAIILAIHYGLRRGEILGLRWRDVSFKEKSILIKNTRVKVKSRITKKPKTQSSIRSYPLINNIHTHLQKVYEKQKEYKTLFGSEYIENDYICKYPNGKLYSTDKVSKNFRNLLKQNNMPFIRFHDIRHSTASYLLKLGLTMKEIQEWLGHSDFNLTMNTYSHIDTAMKKNAAEKVNKLFEKGFEE
jgi:integrase